MGNLAPQKYILGGDDKYLPTAYYYGIQGNIMAQIFFTKSKQRPSAFATLGLVVVFLSFVTLAGAGPVTGMYQQSSIEPEVLLQWRLQLLELARLLLLAGSLITLIGILHGRFSSRVRTSWRGFVAVTITGLVALPLWAFTNAKNNAPILHDITTNISDPPYFRHLPERSYSTNQLADMRGGRLDSNYVQTHTENHSSIKTLLMDATPKRGLDAAIRAANEMGWTLEHRSDQYNQAEFSYVHPFYQLRSNIAVRMRKGPNSEDGKTSTADIRAVSLVGTTDYGLNAALVREFLIEIAKQTP